MRPTTPRWVPAHPPPGHSYERRGTVLRVAGRQRGFIDTAKDVGARGAELDALIAEHRDFFARRGEAVEWKTRAHDEPADLIAHLELAGFVAEPRETVVIALTQELAVEPALPDGVRLRRVHERAELDRVAAMEAAVWHRESTGLAEGLAKRIQAEPDEIAVLIAEAGGEVISAAWLVINAGTEFAGLWGGATVVPWRGRGIYRALVARRAQLALARRARFLHVDASEDSRPILLRLGFQAVTTTTPFVWTPRSAG